MFNKWFRRKKEKEEKPNVAEKAPIFSTHRYFAVDSRTKDDVLEEAFRHTFRVRKLTNVRNESGATFDASIPALPIYSNVHGQHNLSSSLMAWYGTQGFLSSQITAMIGQHWLVSTAVKN